MPRGRPTFSDPPISWEVRIPTSLAAKVELALFDPITERVRYGARGELVAKLLTEWLEKRVKKEVQDEQHSGEHTSDTDQTAVGGSTDGPAKAG